MTELLPNSDLQASLGGVTALQSATDLAPLDFMARSETALAALPHKDDADLVEQIVKKAATSFYWGMRILPQQRRDAMFALYAFCREVDDIADEEGSDQAKAQALSGWKTEIDLLYHTETQLSDFRTAIGRQLFQAHQAFDLQREDFFAIIDGMAMDAVAIQAPSWDAFDLYCDRVASAVGRVSVCIFGTPKQFAIDLAYHQGRALQITNILRDIEEDAGRDRLYLPRNILQQYQIEDSVPSKVLTHPNLPQVAEALGAIAEQHYLETNKILAQCPAESAKPSRIMAAIYEDGFNMLKQQGWHKILTPVRQSKWRKLYVALKAAYF